MHRMPQDTPTAAPTPVAETIVGYFPPDFAMQLDDALDNAVALTLRRVKPGKAKVVHREQLQREGKPVAHGSRTERSHEEIAAQLYEIADDNATSECNCNALYRVTIAYAKPPAGKTASAREIELQIGVAFDTPEAQQRHDFISLLLADRRELFAQHINLLKATSGAYASTSAMADAMSSAFVKIHTTQLEVAAQSDTRALAKLQLDQDNMRIDTFKGLVEQVMPLVRAKMGIPEPQKAELPPMLKIARQLALSFRPEQLAIITRDLPFMQRAVSMKTEAELLALVVELLQAPSDKFPGQLEGTLSAEQQRDFEAIIMWANAQPTKAALPA
jgi:hypothetical protein